MHRFKCPTNRFALFANIPGPVWILLATLMWSTNGWFAKNTIFDSWPESTRGLMLAFWRAAFAGALLLPLARKARWTPRLIPATCSFALMNVTFLSAMTLTTAANAIWLQSTAPIWVFLLGALLFGQSAARADRILLIFGALGVGTILAFEVWGQQPMGVFYGLLSGAFYGGVIVSLRTLSGENTAWLIALCHLVAALVLLPFVAWQGIWPSAEQLIWLAAFGLLQMGLPYLLFARGLRTVSAQEAAGIALLEPILVPVWVYLAWSEVPAWWTVLGAALILTGLAFRYLSPRAKARCH